MRLIDLALPLGNFPGTLAVGLRFFQVVLSLGKLLLGLRHLALLIIGSMRQYYFEMRRGFGDSRSLSRGSQESNQKLPDRRWYPNVGSGRTPLDDYRVGRACAAVIGRRLCRMLFHASRDAFSLHGKLPQDSWEFHFSTSLRRRFTMVLIVATAALPTGVARRLVHVETCRMDNGRYRPMPLQVAFVRICFRFF